MIYMTFLGGVLGPFIQEKEQEAGPKHPLKKSYRSYFKRALIRWVIWRSSKKDNLVFWWVSLPSPPPKKNKERKDGVVDGIPTPLIKSQVPARERQVAQRVLVLSGLRLLTTWEILPSSHQIQQLQQNWSRTECITKAGCRRAPHGTHLPYPQKRSPPTKKIAGVLRGNTTRNSERKMALWEGLWEGLWKTSENL